MKISVIALCSGSSLLVSFHSVRCGIYCWVYWSLHHSVCGFCSHRGWWSQAGHHFSSFRFDDWHFVKFFANNFLRHRCYQGGRTGEGRGLGFPEFGSMKIGVFSTIKVWVSCSWWCPGTSPHFMSLNLCCSGSNIGGKVDGPWRIPCQKRELLGGNGRMSSGLSIDESKMGSRK